MDLTPTAGLFLGLTFAAVCAGFPVDCLSCVICYMLHNICASA